MAQFWTASNVATTSGNVFVTVNTGDDVSLISPNSFLQIGINQFVEVKTVNTSASPQTIELFLPWPNSTGTGQSAIAAPTKAEIKQAADEIRALRLTYESLANDISVTAVANTVVKRDANSRIKTATPSVSEDAVNLGYLGTAANKDITATATDTTAGRLLKVGDFGIGNIITLNVVDLNTVNTVHNTSYYCINCTNRPIAPNGYMQVLDYVTGQYAVQEYRPVTTNAVYHRTLSLGVWSAWSEMGTEANNSLIEFGSNANGSFTKFPDGTLICRHTLTTSVSVGVVWTYPISFTGAPTVQSPTGVAATALMTSVQNILTTSVGVNAYNSSGTRIAVSTLVTAIGRWK